MWESASIVACFGLVSSVACVLLAVAVSDMGEEGGGAVAVAVPWLSNCKWNQLDGGEAGLGLITGDFGGM